MELTKETSLFKKDAIKTDVIAAAATATNYIEDVSGSNQTGMTLQPASNSADNYMQLDATEIGIYQNGHKIASYGNIITLYRLVNNNPVKTLEITGTGLQLYGSNVIDADVSLTSAGLVLKKGGIQVGTPGQNGFVYLSTEDYPLKDSNVTPPISGLTINGYTPTAAQTDGRTVNDAPWRQIIGTNFGITSDGILYANGAHITGQITIDGHAQNLSNEMASLQTATNDAATQATNFLTNLTGIDGLVVRKDALSNNDYVNIQANVIRMVANNVESFKISTDSQNATTIRIGPANAGYISISNNLIQFRTSTSFDAIKMYYDNLIRRAFMGTDVSAPIGGTYKTGLFTSGGSFLLSNRHRSDNNDTLSYSDITGSIGNLTLSLDDENTASNVKPGAFISLTTDQTQDGYYVEMTATNAVKIKAPHIYFNRHSRGASTQFGDINYIYMTDIPPGSTGNYVMRNEAGYLTKGPSSSKRYKHDITPIFSKELDPHQLYNIEVIQFIYNDDCLEQKDQRFRKKVPGFIAEDIYKYYPIAVDLKDGRPEDWNHRFILPPMLKLIQEQHQEIEELKAKITILEEKIL